MQTFEANIIPAGTYETVNVGIIFMLPFLNNLFEALGIIDKGQFVKDFAPQKALAALQYITFGNKAASEQSLVLLKILCGLDSVNFRVEKITLSTLEIEAIDECINTLIYYWQGLHNLSIEGLRDAFLSREGICNLDAKQLTILVVSTSYDILLDKYPYNISIAKLPWLPQLIHVHYL